MAASNLRLQSILDANENRRFQRVPVKMFGRYMLESRREYPCQTVEMSPGDMTLFAPVKAEVGEKVVVYLDEIGRFAGVAVRVTDTGFAMAMNLPPMKRDKLADQLTWFANRHAFNLPEDRRHERIVPLMQRTLLRMPDGQELMAKIRDISLSGVGVETDARPPLGARILVGSTPALVVRHFDSGIGGEFERPFAVGEIDESTRL
ncbi:PilZ domain-containing protein [Methylocystis sp. WRRC1]|uniref:PilZ domain-containing protein n=1 Tax=unclassified Methylocystis TaxID=2625913 RepID=UPI0001F873CC|nr:MULTISPECIES: PilZ domain-containing protein [unclassified Methylocystis]MCC3244223.1 PilZ domain-containing protein [Methylocystis sp. WRRC1]